MNELNKNELLLDRVQKILSLMICCAFVLAFALSINMGVAYCTDPAKEATSTINDAISDASDNIYGVLKHAIMPLAGLGFAIAAFRLIFGGERGMQSAFKIALLCCGAIAMVFLSPLLIKAFGGWFIDSAGDMSSVNTLFD